MTNQNVGQYVHFEYKTMSRPTRTTLKQNSPHVFRLSKATQEDLSSQFLVFSMSLCLLHSGSRDVFRAAEHTQVLCILCSAGRSGQSRRIDHILQLAPRKPCVEGRSRFNILVKLFEPEVCTLMIDIVETEGNHN